MPKVELFGSPRCEHTESMRAWLEFRGVEFVEYDVETDRSALDRLRGLIRGQRTVPVLVEDGRVAEIGWQGRGCVVASGD
jgi:glutaredoxin 3